MSLTLPYNFTPRTYQEDFFAEMNSGCKRAILCWHRRCGKDLTVWNHLICTAYETKGTYYYIFPTFAQGRKVVWDGMTNSGVRFLDYIPKELILGKPNASEMKIRLVNGSLIQIVGSDNYDSLMGTNPVGCIFSEYSLQDPHAWDHVRPILDLNGGWAVFVYTPRGSNHGKTLYDMAKRNKNWYVSKLTVDDTGLLSKDDIKRIQDEGMSIDMIMQEYYVSFERGIAGSYYANYVQAAYDEDRVCRLAYQRSSLVSTAWDIGWNDHTSIIFYQLVGNEVHIIDHYENMFESMSHYVEVVKSKGYQYSKHFGPHDIESNTQATGASPRSVAAALDLDFTVLERTRVIDGIEQCRGTFHRCYFDQEKCKSLLVSLENYRSEYDSKRDIYSSKPARSKHNHNADAFRYMCQAVNSYQSNAAIIDDKKARDLRNQYLPNFNA